MLYSVPFEIRILTVNWADLNQKVAGARTREKVLPASWRHVSKLEIRICKEKNIVRYSSGPGWEDNQRILWPFSDCFVTILWPRIIMVKNGKTFNDRYIRFSIFYRWKIKFLYLFLHLLIQISPQNHNCNVLNVFLPFLAIIMQGQRTVKVFSEPGRLGNTLKAWKWNSFSRKLNPEAKFYNIKNGMNWIIFLFKLRTTFQSGRAPANFLSTVTEVSPNQQALIAGWRKVKKYQDWESIDPIRQLLFYYQHFVVWFFFH